MLPGWFSTNFATGPGENTTVAVELTFRPVAPVSWSASVTVSATVSCKVDVLTPFAIVTTPPPVAEPVVVSVTEPSNVVAMFPELSCA